MEKITKEEEKRKKQFLIQCFTKATGLSFQFVGLTLIFAGLGYTIDKKFGTEFWFLILGFVIGCILGGWRIYLFIKTSLR